MTTVVTLLISCFFCRLDLSVGTSHGSGVAFSGLMYASGVDPAALPLVSPQTVSLSALRTELLEEVKDVLIPPEQLGIQHDDVIGKGTCVNTGYDPTLSSVPSSIASSFFLCFLSYKPCLHLTSSPISLSLQAILEQFTMATLKTLTTMKFTVQ